ncbi:MAG: hypothetical protein KAH07_01385 [Flavobacteriaceae bacterium]|nr:hypothetical protein [Flavobacteriaceae bacterium]
MHKLKVSLVLILFSILSSFSQENLNDYKYIIIPSQFDFQKSKDSFQINSLLKFLFEKTDFEVYLDTDKFPEELAKNRCLGLTAKLDDNSKIFSARTNIDLVDCQNRVVYTTAEGVSKMKDIKKAYHESIRKTFAEIEKLEYAYNPVSEVVAAPVIASSSGKNDVGQVNIDNIVLYAQPTANGYQLVDSTPQVIYVLNKTAVKDVYLIEGQDGKVYKEGAVWKIDTYVDGKLETKELSLKFF